MEARRIALFLWSFDNDYQALLRSGCAASARRYGYLLDEFSADGDGERQVRQISEVLRAPEARRPAAMLVCPVWESSLLTTAQQAARQGIGWVVLNRYSEYLHQLRREYSALPIFCVNPDQNEIGRIQGRQFRALLPQGGELLYIQGPPLTSSARGRLEGAQQEIAGTPINMMTFSADWSAEGAAKVVHDWAQLLGTQQLPPCIIGAQNDHMAEGAKRALREQANRLGRPELARIPVTGCDGSPRFGQRLVSEGRLAATVVMPSTAGPAVEGLRSALDTGQVPPLEVRLSVTSYPSVETLTRMVGASPVGSL